MCLTDIHCYIHIPFCEKKCPYCNFYSEPVCKYQPDLVIDAIINELNRYQIQNAKTLYIGGGSPSCLPLGTLKKLLKAIHPLKPEELSCELNPCQMNTALLEMLYANNVNRLSIGAQSFYPDDLKTLGRKHTFTQIVEAVNTAFEIGFNNINLDLIFAIPGQDIFNFEYSLKSVINLDVTHVSAYSLSYEHGTAFHKKLLNKQMTVTSEKTDRQMYELAIDLLTDAGYCHYEISNFARSGYECRHNLATWNNQQYIGIGPSAHSYFQDKRYCNLSSIQAYIDKIKKQTDAIATCHQVTPEEKICETLVLGLRKTEGVSLSALQAQIKFDILHHFKTCIDRFVNEGLLEHRNDRLYLTRKGLPIADHILCEFSSL